MTTSGAPGDFPSRDLGLKEAARVANVSLSTLRRMRDDLLQHGATRHADGSWSIPPHTLVALHLLDQVTPSAAPAGTRHLRPVDTRAETPGETRPDTRSADELAAELLELREQLVAAEQRAELAEAGMRWAERLIETQERALRALEAPRTAESAPETTQRPSAAPEGAQKAAEPTTTPATPAGRRWWGGRRRPAGY